MTESSRPFERHEWFARAVEELPKNDTSVRPATASSTNTPVDAMLADDLAVVGLLRRSAPDLGPDQAARERMRQRVLAALAADSDTLLARPDAAPVTPMPAAPAAEAADTAQASVLSLHGDRPSRGIGFRRTRAGRTGRQKSYGQIALVLAAAASVVLATSGLGVLLSRNAVPGDGLYWIKRGAETASLGLSFSGDSAGRKHLEFATDRLDELSALTSRDEPPPAADDHYVAALGDFDSDAAAASRELTRLGTGDGQTLDSLRRWAATQSVRLVSMENKLPESARGRLANSLLLLADMQQRSTALLNRLNCRTVTSGSSDDLGPLPAEDLCVPRTDTKTATSDPAAVNAKPADTSGSSSSAPLSSSGRQSAPALPSAPSGSVQPTSPFGNNPPPSWWPQPPPSQSKPPQPSGGLQIPLFSN